MSPYYLAASNISRYIISDRSSFTKVPIMMLRRGIRHPGEVHPRVDELILRQIQIARDDDRIIVPVQCHFVHVVSPCEK